MSLKLSQSLFLFVLSCSCLSSFHLKVNPFTSSVHADKWLNTVSNLNHVASPSNSLSKPSATSLKSSVISEVETKSASNNNLNTYENSEKLRKWFLLNYQKRTEITFSESATVEDVIGDVWKAILISFKVLHKNRDDENNEKMYSSLQAFPRIQINADAATSTSSNNANAIESSPAINNALTVKKSMTMDDFKYIETQINEFLQSESCKTLLQPEYEYKVQFIFNNPSSSSSSSSSSSTAIPFNLSFLIFTETHHMTQDFTVFDNIENLQPEDLPEFEDTVINNVPTFPFPSVYDFISEINRPADVLTMNNLKFKFQVADLKFSVEQMKKKKKNPQDFVDAINCQLTRLQKWREVLMAPDETAYDMFDNQYEWGKQVRRKYESMVVQARKNPMFAMDNQYNKRQVFIKIIDEWSLRLKRSFKFIYQSKRSPPQDFLAPILASSWRQSVIALTRLPAKAAFLDLDGPVDFQPGQPQELFNETRRMVWDEKYPVSLALFESLTFVTHVESIKARHPISSDSDSDEVEKRVWLPFGTITQHTYSRGKVTERLLLDCWRGLTLWTYSLTGSAGSGSMSSATTDSDVIYSPYGSQVLFNELLARSSPQVKSRFNSNTAESSSNINSEEEEEEEDHTTVFKNTLQQLNAVARQSSSERATSVKEMFKQDFTVGKELNEWWTTLVRDLDMVDLMGRIADGTASLSEIDSLGGSSSSDISNNRDAGGGVNGLSTITSSTATAGGERPNGWSEVMERVVTSSLREGDANALGDGIDSQAAAEFASSNAELWSQKYKPVITQAETLASLLPWRSQSQSSSSSPLSSSPSSSSSGNKGSGSGSMSDGKEIPLDLEIEGRAMSWLNKALSNIHINSNNNNKNDGVKTGGGERNTKRSGNALNKDQQNALLMQDTVHVAFNESLSSSINNIDANNSIKYVSYLFVAPCYFRGIGLDFELGAFLEFTKMMQTLFSISPLLPSLSASAIQSIELIPLHPHMVNTATGLPDYIHRAPHPSILFRIPVDKL